jgi:hypothetical protein
MLAGFHRRGDLRRFADDLYNSGIAGTDIYFRFYWPTAHWLARRHPGSLTIDWPEFENQEQLEKYLYLLASASETPALDEEDFPLKEWLDRLKGPRETDAAFLIGRFAAMPVDAAWRERLYDDLDIGLRLAPGKGTPSRTVARSPRAKVVYQETPLSRLRPDLKREIFRPPVAVTPVSPREGQRLVDMARDAMVTRSRDLDVFANGDPEDVRLVDCGGGLQFACIGVVPQRRLMLESVYGFLTMKNGVPTGYVLASALFGSSEVAYNIFETYREAESAAVYGRVLAMLRHLFGSDAFTIDPYQLGHDNLEGLESGAWWFYYKLGFRPDDPEVLRLLSRELRRMEARPGHRSSVETLQELSAENMYLFLGRPRKAVLGRFSLASVGHRMTRYLARRFGADREEAARVCSREAARLLGLRSLRGFSAGQRLAWERWAPLVVNLPGASKWTAAEKKALVAVVRAKGGRRESDFVLLFNRHRALQRALGRMGRQ